MVRRNKSIVVDYHQKFGDEQGARILADLQKQCPLMTGGIDISKGIDQNKVLVLEGRSDILKYINRMMGKDPNEERVVEARNINTVTETGE
ncbi:MAG: hypothetical protein GY941_21675 [Planctomycetes bacterium]|nr:hypothetical protein [Planctomycetota bacterium]